MNAPRNSRVSIYQIAEVLQLPLPDAARHLGVCVAQVKRICRRNGIARWPQRKMFSEERMIKQVEMTGRMAPSAFSTLRTGIHELAALRHGTFGVVAVVPKLDEILALAEVQQLLPVISYRRPVSAFAGSMPVYQAPIRDCGPSHQPSLTPVSASIPEHVSLHQKLSVPLHDHELQYLKSRLHHFSEYCKQHGR
eukprot:TRINITY_DN3777_c0_g3_i1.p1 TRINITY_DN3777_c0_g3~~TRINITY_DN3777_c0_g3_i1.p1  ORF type:complete len:194 (-),score=15.44 TRINITY_DN3777_c0_g3_i1:22-603(-)